MATVEAYRRNDFMFLGNRKIKTRLTRMKPTAIRPWYLLSDFDSGSFIANKIFSKGIVSFFDWQKCCIFELPNSINWAYSRPKQGHFLCPTQYGGSVLLNVGVSPHSPVEGFGSRKGTTAFYLGPTLKIFAMPSNSTSTKCASLAITAETILNDLVTTDEISRMRQHLRDMLDAYLLDEDDSKYRHDIYSTYMALDILLTRIENLTLNTIAA